MPMLRGPDGTRAWCYPRFTAVPMVMLASSPAHEIQRLFSEGNGFTELAGVSERD